MALRQGSIRGTATPIVGATLPYALLAQPSQCIVIAPCLAGYLEFFAPWLLSNAGLAAVAVSSSPTVVPIGVDDALQLYQLQQAVRQWWGHILRHDEGRPDVQRGAVRLPAGPFSGLYTWVLKPRIRRGNAATITGAYTTPTTGRELDHIIQRLYVDVGNRCVIDRFVISQLSQRLGTGPWPREGGEECYAIIYAYQGVFAGNEYKQDCPFTCENTIMYALRAAGVVGANTVPLERMGRTDAGVAAACQIVALRMRAGLVGDAGAQLVAAVNVALGPLLVMLAIEPLRFSPRHDCCFRYYKYLIGRNIVASTAIEITQRLQELVGTHDFRYLSHGTAAARRTILAVKLECHGDLAVLHVHARAFAYHQIRILAAVVIRMARNGDFSLLHRVFTGALPFRAIASPRRLCLCHCGYDAVTYDSAFLRTNAHYCCLAADMRLRHAPFASQ